MEKIVKFSEILNESKQEDWQDKIAGWDNALILYCDKDGKKLIKEMKLADHGLEAFSHGNIIVIAPISGSDKTSLNKFKNKFLK